MYQAKYFDLTDKERAKGKKLTPKERAAVDAFLAAAKALPRSLCIDLDEVGITVSKRITPGAAMQVAALRKRTLEF